MGRGSMEKYLNTKYYPRMVSQWGLMEKYPRIPCTISGWSVNGGLWEKYPSNSDSHSTIPGWPVNGGYEKVS